MTGATKILLRASEATEQGAGVVARRFEVDLTKCVVEVVFRMFGLNLWRVRLRPIAAQLRLQPYGGSLSAHVAVKPLFASIPLSLGRFLPKAPRDERITVVIGELPTFSAPGTVEADGLVSVGNDSWVVPFALRCIFIDDQHIVVAITGTVPQRSDGVVPMTPIRIDAAAEFTQWL
jgi:hypothetical protein